MTDKEKVAVLHNFIQREYYSGAWDNKPYGITLKNMLDVLESNIDETDKELTIEEWDWECDDGCCYEYGVNLYLNNEEVAREGTLSEALLEFVRKLGYTIKDE